METVSYPALSFMWLSQKTGRSDRCLSHKCVLHSQLCSDLSAHICLRRLPAGMLFASFPTAYVAPATFLKRSPWGASIWMCLATEPRCPPPLPVLTPPTGKAMLCARKQTDVDSTVWQALGKSCSGCWRRFFTHPKIIEVFNFPKPHLIWESLNNRRSRHDTPTDLLCDLGQTTSCYGVSFFFFNLCNEGKWMRSGIETSF